MSTAKEMLDFYLSAERRVLSGQSVAMNGRSWTMADLDKIREGRKEWEQRVRDEQSGPNGAALYPRHQLAEFGP